MLLNFFQVLFGSCCSIIKCLYAGCTIGGDDHYCVVTTIPFSTTSKIKHLKDCYILYNTCFGEKNKLLS